MRFTKATSDLAITFVHASTHSLHVYKLAPFFLGIFLIFVLSINKYDLIGVGVFATVPLIMSLLLHLPLFTILKRCLIISPFIFIMASVNFFLDPEPFFQIANVTLNAGTVSGLVIVGKSFVMISAIFAYTLSTPFYFTCQALRRMYVPDIFITQIMLLYRYSFLLVEEAMAMQKARNLRSFGKKGKDLFTTAKLIGSLLLRTTDRADRIYKGMLARGFNGTFIKKRSEPFTVTDYLILLSFFIVIGFVRLIF